MLGIDSWAPYKVYKYGLFSNEKIGTKRGMQPIAGTHAKQRKTPTIPATARVPPKMVQCQLVQKDVSPPGFFNIASIGQRVSWILCPSTTI
jgi:hypothetical protein